MTTRGSKRLRVEAPALISVTTRSQVLRIPSSARLPIGTDNSRCVCCRCLAGMRSGIREDYGPARLIYASGRGGDGTTPVDDHSRRQISSASRKFFRNDVEGISISSRVGHGPGIWICKCGPARCDACKNKDTLFDGAVNLAFYGFRYGYVSRNGKNISRILSRIVMSTVANFYMHTL